MCVQNVFAASSSYARQEDHFPKSMSFPSLAKGSRAPTCAPKSFTLGLPPLRLRARGTILISNPLTSGRQVIYTSALSEATSPHCWGQGQERTHTMRSAMMRQWPHARSERKSWGGTQARKTAPEMVTPRLPERQRSSRSIPTSAGVGTFMRAWSRSMEDMRAAAKRACECTHVPAWGKSPTSAGWFVEGPSAFM